MTRVAVLAHVKESSLPVPPPPTSSGPGAGPRIAWSGGKIVSNKAVALRKFYERKLQDPTLSASQRAALEAQLRTVGASEKHGDDDGDDDDDDDDQDASPRGGSHRHHRHHHANPKKRHPAPPHHSHMKVSGRDGSKKTIVINGRVLGPKVLNSRNGAKSEGRRAARLARAPTTKKPRRAASSASAGAAGGGATGTSSGLALTDKLEMSLDALVKRRQA